MERCWKLDDKKHRELVTRPSFAYSSSCCLTIHPGAKIKTYFQWRQKNKLFGIMDVKEHPQNPTVALINQPMGEGKHQKALGSTAEHQEVSRLECSHELSRGTIIERSPIKNLITCLKLETPRSTLLSSPERDERGRWEDNVSIITVKLQARRKRSGHGHTALLSY